MGVFLSTYSPWCYITLRVEGGGHHGNGTELLTRVPCTISLLDNDLPSEIHSEKHLLFGDYPNNFFEWFFLILCMHKFLRNTINCSILFSVWCSTLWGFCQQGRQIAFASQVSRITHYLTEIVSLILNFSALEKTKKYTLLTFYSKDDR